MFATHDDLATAEFNVLECQRKLTAQRMIIHELQRRGQSIRLAEKFLARLDQELALCRSERDAICSRMRSEIDISPLGPFLVPIASSQGVPQYPE